jgi:hypothetical protein
MPQWSWVLLACALAVVPARVQQPVASSARIAFRVDDSRLVANLRVLDDPALQQVTAGLSPIARLGYSYIIDPPSSWAQHVPSSIPGGTRWIVHAGPGKTFEAVAERVVGGDAPCNPAIGVLLSIRPEQAAAFAALRARYFVAEPVALDAPIRLSTRSSVSTLSSSAISAELRGKLETLLGDLLTRELPGVRGEAAPGLARMASSPVGFHRSWARERRAMEAGLAAGRGRLFFDVQAFHLSPDRVPYYFVRATWRVNGRLGFAAALWLRGSDLDVVWRNLRPAAWLRMFEFQGVVGHEHLGMVLNVLDRDGDGWGELVFLQSGLESRDIAEWRFSPSGFARTDVAFSYGC